MTSLLKPKICLNLLSIRGALRPPPNLPYLGLYRTEGEVVQQDELLVSQKKLNYHPGAN
uniref:Uncharacterized protein n=1 Tax=Panagrolaimus sp. ES5 TaxID=591445 RepID=A0AC34GF17_9BILA